VKKLYKDFLPNPKRLASGKVILSVGIILRCIPVILTSAIFSFAQTDNIRVDYYTVDQGLSQNQVFCIYQDSKGLLWIGTQDGLNIYDGYNFKIVRHQPGNLNSLPDYAVNAICETDTGIFWIGTREGMSRLDYHIGKFTHYTHNPDSSNSIVNNNIWFIKEDSEKNLWIATRNGLSKFNPLNNSFENFQFSPSDTNSISHNFVFYIVEDNNKNIWIGGRGGLDRYDLKRKRFFNYKLYPENPDVVSLNGILTLYIQNEILWIGSYSGLYSVNLKEIENDKINLRKHILDKSKQHSIRSIYGDKDETLWMGTLGTGLFRFKPETGETILYKSSNKTGSISEDYIGSLLEDNHHVLWIGTSGSGLNKYNRASERFKTITLPESEESKKSGVSSLLEDTAGNLWIGTKSGDIIKVTGQFTNNAKYRFYKTEKYLRTYFSQIELKSILEDRNGNIWAGSFGNGIYIIDPKSDKVKRIRGDINNNNTIANDFIHCIYESSDGNIWIGTGAGGLNKFNPVDKSFVHYRHDPNNSKSVSTDEVTAVCEDKQGFIWAGTSIGGLSRLDPGNGDFERFTHNISDINTISSNRIICLYLDKKSDLWIGTFGGGLNKWNPESKSFIHYTTANGLPSNIICSILEDSFGNLWISTDKGISKFNSELNTFKNYDYTDGLQGNEFLHGSGFKSKTNNHFYFGGVNGLNIFNPNDFNAPGKLSDIIFTDFKIFNKSVLPGEESALSTNILYAKEITLSYDQNFITFEFSSMDFNNPSKNQYAYMLEGFNKNWINAGNQRIATYTNLDPGEYIFRVKATNSDGIWNEDGISIRVILHPPWWQTWWAYILYAFAFAGILYGARQFELNRVKLRNQLEIKHFEAQKLQEVDQMKSRFFANISHEFRTPLTLILGMLDRFQKKSVIAKDKNDLQVMKNNAERLLQLINQLLELSRLEAGSERLQAIKTDLIKFVRRIIASLLSLAEQKKLMIKFNGIPFHQIQTISSKEDNEIFVYFDREMIETVIYNLLGNAIKFSPEGEEINISINKTGRFAEIIIMNTGVAIPEEKLPYIFNRFYQVDDSGTRGYEGTGIGLALAKELIELHSGEIAVYSSDYERDETTFVVRLPWGRTHLKDDEVIDLPSELPEVEKELIEDQLFKAPIEVSTGSHSLKTDSKIILIVEDHEELRKFLRENLEEDFVVLEAEDGIKGLSTAEEIIPDLIISDVMMPKMDGYELCKLLKTNEKTNHIPVILLTAKAAAENKLEGLETGADDYLIKPFNPDELKLRVKNLIKIRQQLREKFRTKMVLKPGEITVPSSQKVFLEKLTSVIEDHLEDEKFGIEVLCDKIGMSRAQLHRKIKAITNQSTTEFIRSFRLQRAADLLKQDAGNMAEIAYKVGFNSQAYFTKSFQEEFGCSPMEYKKRETAKQN
jgi:signal transduction histidine kinase/ligand-binding sensor domain-containing protein/DNA-binding response OmpR family regulator